MRNIPGLAAAPAMRLLRFWAAGAAFLMPLCCAHAQHTLPFPAQTRWNVMVFGCFFPEEMKQQPAPYTIQVKWNSGGQEHSQTLSGEVKWLEIAVQELTLPPNVERFSLTLDWKTVAIDLDLGMQQIGGPLRIAPLITVLKPEAMVYTPEFASLLNWLDSNYPGWTEGYPFWADIKSSSQEGTP